MNVVPTLPLTFEAMYRLGYTRLVPIIPPDSLISPKSSLALRVGTDQDSRGKAVGIRGQDGNWFGFSKRARVIMYNKEKVSAVAPRRKRPLRCSRDHAFASAVHVADASGAAAYGAAVVSDLSISSACMMNAQTSACSSIALLVGFPPP